MVLKLICDLEETDLNTLFEKFSKKDYDFCFSDSIIYLYTKNNTLSSVRNIMKEVKVDNYFIKTLKKDDFKTPEYNIIDNWCLEKIALDEKIELENSKQEEMRNMLNNINKVRLEILKNKEKEGDNIGG